MAGKKQMNGRKPTTFHVTKSTVLLENEILAQLDIPRLTFHRRAFRYFLDNDIKVHPNLLITERKDPRYIRKTATEQTVIDNDMKAALEEAAERNNCGITIVMFQALMTYCSVVAPIVLGDDVIANITMGAKRKDLS